MRARGERRGRRGREGGGLIGKGIKGLAAGVGLVSESVSAHKESKEQKKREEEEASMSRTQSESSGPALRGDIPYRGTSEGQMGGNERNVDVPNIEGPPPAYDAGPSYQQAGGSQQRSGGSGQHGYPDEKAAGWPYEDERGGGGQYQGESSRQNQYQDERPGQSQYPDEKAQYRDERSGPSQYQGQSSSQSQNQDPRPGLPQYQSSRSTGSDYPDEKRGGLSPNAAKDEELENDLEDDWALDDAQDELTRDPTQEPPPPAGALEDEFLLHHPPPNYAVGRLPMPVVLPQRRPKTRSRGFIRAYAPVLENCGIDQATWLEFLDSFQRNSAASPWINAINMAQFATFALPFGIGLAVGYAIQQGVKVATEVHARERTNKFLHKINEQFFRPRGLFCLVMTWNPASHNNIESIDLNQTIVNRATSSPSMASKFRSSDGNTYGEWQFPETAPLIFPALDKLASQTGEEAEKKQGRMAKGKGFLADYWDKRATAEYAGKNPNSMLANVPQAKFSSRYADPNHPAASGSLVAFVSGGHLVPAPGSRGLIGGLVSAVKEKGKEKQAPGQVQYGNGSGQGEYGNEEDNIYSRNYRGRRGRRDRSRSRDGRKGGLVTGQVKKLLNQNVLYMMVVNMPSEEEMAASQAAGARR